MPSLYAQHMPTLWPLYMPTFWEPEEELYREHFNPVPPRHEPEQQDELPL